MVINEIISFLNGIDYIFCIDMPRYTFHHKRHIKIQKHPESSEIAIGNSIRSEQDLLKF